MEQKTEINHQALIEVQDQYLAIQQQTHFICDAVVAMAESRALSSHTSINGLRLEARQLKCSMRQLQVLLQTV